MGTVSPAGLAARCNVQETPFQRSASVTLSPDLPRASPTAVHPFDEEQETDSICPRGAVALGECSLVHAGCASLAAAGPENAAARIDVLVKYLRTLQAK